MTAAITRDQEQRLYRYLQRVIVGDQPGSASALRYELIAKKVQRAADGTASPWELAIAEQWLALMMADDAPPAGTAPIRPAREPWAEVRAGRVGNPYYQAFLDTLEQHELDAIQNNVPYFLWHSARSTEAARLGVPLYEYAVRWANDHLSTRVKEQRKCAPPPTPC